MNFSATRWERNNSIKHFGLKVESDPEKNADRRVLYDRWKNKGDPWQCSVIDSQNPGLSSRVWCKSNFLKLSSLSLTLQIFREHAEKDFRRTV